MGISIYYAAHGKEGLSEPERSAVEEVVRGYRVANRIEEHHRTGDGWNGEDFGLSDPPFDSQDTVLEGAPRLPDHDEDVSWVAVRPWCEPLSEIRRLLPDAEWYVHVDDLDILWDADRRAFDPERQSAAEEEGRKAGEQATRAWRG